MVKINNFRGDLSNISAKAATLAVGDPDDILAQPKRTDRQNLEEFVYDFFLFNFGVREVAEVHLAAFCAAVVRLKDSNKKIKLFGRLLGIFDAFSHVRRC